MFRAECELFADVTLVNRPTAAEVARQIQLVRTSTVDYPFSIDPRTIKALRLGNVMYYPTTLVSLLEGIAEYKYRDRHKGTERCSLLSPDIDRTAIEIFLRAVDAYAWRPTSSPRSADARHKVSKAQALLEVISSRWQPVLDESRKVVTFRIAIGLKSDSDFRPPAELLETYRPFAPLQVLDYLLRMMSSIREDGFPAGAYVLDLASALVATDVIEKWELRETIPSWCTYPLRDSIAVARRLLFGDKRVLHTIANDLQNNGTRLSSTNEDQRFSRMALPAWKSFEYSEICDDLYATRNAYEIELLGTGILPTDIADILVVPPNEFVEHINLDDPEYEERIVYEEPGVQIDITDLPPLSNPATSDEIEALCNRILDKVMGPANAGEQPVVGEATNPDEIKALCNRILEKFVEYRYEVAR